MDEVDADMSDFALSTTGPASGRCDEKMLEAMPSPTGIDLLAAAILDNDWVSPMIIRAFFSAEIEAPRPRRLKPRRWLGC